MAIASQAFPDVTVEMVTLIKRIAHAQHGVRFDPVEGTNGTATGRTPFGDCVVHFNHDKAEAVLVLTLLKKPMLFPASLLWSGFKGEIERCRKLV